MLAGGITQSCQSIGPEQLRNWKLLERFRQEIVPLLETAPRSASEQDERRTVVAEDYFSAYLFAMLNPVISSMRVLCHASHCQKMRQVCSRPLSPASFSDAQHVFKPEILDQVVRSLCRQALGRCPGGDTRTRQALKALTAVDGTLLRAVPRMQWARSGGPTWAVRLHLHFSVFDQVPEAWTVTAGTVCERKVFRQVVKPGSMIVADRYYSEPYALLKELQDQGVDFVFRLNDDAFMEPVEPSRELTAQDRKAGVVWDCQMHLGVRGRGPVLRVVRIESGGQVFLLVTTRQDLSAELISLIYRQRWQIELFFKWLKTILNCRHWLAQSPEGVTIQIYCVLIAALLLMLWTGQRPNKRTVDSLRFYWLGWATEAELIELLRRANPLKKS